VNCEISWVKPTNPQYWLKEYGIKLEAKYLVFVTVGGKVAAIYESNRRRYVGSKLWPEDSDE